MTDDLDRRYKELRVKEMEEQERKKLEREKAEQAGKKGCLIILGICVLSPFVMMIDLPDITPSKARRTNAGMSIERGADIDYRIDSDKIINLSVKQVRSKGYRCSSLSSIDLYGHNNSIVVTCNNGKDKYRIYPSSGQVTRE